MAFTKAEEDRILKLFSNPELLNQCPKNCCGTVAVISGFLEMYKINKLNKIFNELYNTSNKATKFKGINRSNEVANRLDKRVKANYITEQKDGTSADYKLGIALLIILKEYLKANGKITEKIWDVCEEYSKIMEHSWLHGTKITKKITKMTKPDMTYKNGDIALTREAVQELLKMVSTASDKTIDTVDDLTTCTVAKYIETIKKYKDKKKLLIVMGVKIDTIKDSHGQGSLAHWIYVPRINYDNIVSTTTKQLKVWTWGEEYEVTDFNKLPSHLGAQDMKSLCSYAIRMS